MREKGGTYLDWFYFYKVIWYLLILLNVLFNDVRDKTALVVVNHSL